MGSRVTLEKAVNFTCYAFLLVEASQLVLKFYEYCVRKEEKHDVDIRKPAHLWNTAIFFPSQDALSQNQLLWYLSNASRSLKICMYTFASKSIEELLYQKKVNGVHVEIITMSKFSEWLNLKGYSVRTEPQEDVDQLMHNKFIIIDNEALLTGSLNWSEGMFGNHENLMVTTNPRAVKSYLQEFEKLWSISRRSGVLQDCNR